MSDEEDGEEGKEWNEQRCDAQCNEECDASECASRDEKRAPNKRVAWHEGQPWSEAPRVARCLSNSSVTGSTTSQEAEARELDVLAGIASHPHLAIKLGAA